MAENKVVNTTQLEADLTSIASAIREKTGGSDSLAFPNGFVSAIDGLATSNNLYFFLDEKFTLVDGISVRSSAVVFTSEKLKSLSDYHMLVIEKTSAVTVSNGIYLHVIIPNSPIGNFGKVFYGTSATNSPVNLSSGTYANNLTIDNGSITIQTNTNQVEAGEYRVYIICEKG